MTLDQLKRWHAGRVPECGGLDAYGILAMHSEPAIHAAGGVPLIAMIMKLGQDDYQVRLIGPDGLPCSTMIHGYDLDQVVADAEATLIDLGWTPQRLSDSL